jgi:hypothetical protein
MSSENKQISLMRRKINNISDQLEKSKMSEYISFVSNPRRMLLYNFLGGLARGFGMAIGFTILGAIGVLILQKLVALNLPIIGDYIARIVKIVKIKIE